MTSSGVTADWLALVLVFWEVERLRVTRVPTNTPTNSKTTIKILVAIFLELLSSIRLRVSFLVKLVKYVVKMSHFPMFERI